MLLFTLFFFFPHFLTDKTIKLWKISERDKRPEGYNLKEEDGRYKDPNNITSLRVSPWIKHNLRDISGGGITQPDQGFYLKLKMISTHVFDTCYIERAVLTSSVGLLPYVMQAAQITCPVAILMVTVDVNQKCMIRPQYPRRCFQLFWLIDFFIFFVLGWISVKLCWLFSEITKWNV